MIDSNSRWIIYQLTKKKRIMRIVKVGRTAIIDTKANKAVISLRKIKTINVNNEPPFVSANRELFQFQSNYGYSRIASSSCYFSVKKRKRIGSATYYFEAQSPTQRTEIVHRILEQMRNIQIIPEDEYESSKCAVGSVQNLKAGTLMKMKFIDHQTSSNDRPSGIIFNRLISPETNDREPIPHDSILERKSRNKSNVDIHSSIKPDHMVQIQAFNQGEDRLHDLDLQQQDEYSWRRSTDWTKLVKRYARILELAQEINEQLIDKREEKIGEQNHFISIETRDTTDIGRGEDKQSESATPKHKIRDFYEQLIFSNGDSELIPTRIKGVFDGFVKDIDKKHTEVVEYDGEVDTGSLSSASLVIGALGEFAATSDDLMNAIVGPQCDYVVELQWTDNGYAIDIDAHIVHEEQVVECNELSPFT